MRIYIESTIPSYVVARPARDLIQAANQQTTKDWWDFERAKYELFTSQVVLDEIAAGERAMAEHRVELMAGITILDLLPETVVLGESILKSGLILPAADGDAAHIALATVHGVDILLTWNCRHIANRAIEIRLRRLVQAQGWELPSISTPADLCGA
jgi:hypothetical protein